MLALGDRKAICIEKIPSILQLEAAKALSAILGAGASYKASLEDLLYLPPVTFAKATLDSMVEHEFVKKFEEQPATCLETVQALVRLCQKIISRF